MKRIITLMLTVAMCISLCSCGSMSKEKMLENAQEITTKQLLSDFRDNEAKANQTYVGNTYILSGYVTEITDEYCAFGDSIKVYLPHDELVSLEKDKKIRVVGEIDKLYVTETTMSMGSYSDYNVDVRNAYYVDDVFEITGEVEIMSNKKIFSDGFSYKTTSSNKTHFYIKDSEEVYYAIDEKFIDDINAISASILGEDLMLGDSVTISGTVMKSDIYPAEITPTSIQKN